MTTELLVALIAGAVSLVSVTATILSSLINSGRTSANAKEIENLKIEAERTKEREKRDKEISHYREPLARAAYDLQSRLYNIICLSFLEAFYHNGEERERQYAVNNTVFLVAQYLCWSELVRREIQYIDLGENEKTRKLLELQDTIYSLWGTDQQPKLFRIFAGEQRALGEALIQAGYSRPECLGYGAFLGKFKDGANPLVDALKRDIPHLDGATERLRNIQHALIDLLDMLDPNDTRFPRSRRTRA